jgi:hypothetical protein
MMLASISEDAELSQKMMPSSTSLLQSRWGSHHPHSQSHKMGLSSLAAGNSQEARSSATDEPTASSLSEDDMCWGFFMEEDDE